MFENGTLVKHKARLVVRGFTQVRGIDYNEAHLYAPVMRLEYFRSLVSIAAIFTLDLRQLDVLATQLHGDIDREVIHGPAPGLWKWRLRLALIEKSLLIEAGRTDLERAAQG